ncbi:DNA-binding protein [Clavibacter tessellarius]|nr:DNA-binding protein [Clavibacter michiganensis]UKF33566.1 DNA-binding protein [Clavibacter michiganensis subsp. tessellarius]
MASNAVLAGIAASDAICGCVLRVASSGEDHAQAVELLRTATPQGPAYAKELRRLLEIKTAAQYSPALTSADVATRSLVWAGRLVEAMEDVLARTR